MTYRQDSQYLRRQDPRRVESAVTEHVRNLSAAHPTASRTSPDVMLRAAAAVLLLALLAPGGTIEIGRDTIAERVGGVGTRTVTRSTVWLRNVCRALNRPRRGRHRQGVSIYAAHASTMRAVAARLRREGRRRSRVALDAVATRKAQDTRSQPATVAQVEPPYPGDLRGRPDPALLGRGQLQTEPPGSGPNSVVQVIEPPDSIPSMQRNLSK